MKQTGKNQKSPALGKLRGLGGKIVILAGLVLVLCCLALYVSRRAIIVDSRSKEFVLAINLRTAIQSYYDAYGHYPIPEKTGKRDVFYSSQDARHWGPLIIALCGGVDPAHPGQPVPPALRTVPNPRGLIFVVFNASDLDVSTGVGIPKLSFPDQSGHPQYLNLAMDGNEDGVLGNKDDAAGKLPDFANGQPGGAVVNQPIVLWTDSNPPESNNRNPWVCTY